jgi:bifunctional DNA-binding transcriptional regulator/antitoxin component of YhaV-PrlF toxin-antitoxin module
MLIVQRSTVYVYGLAALDDRGRLADRTIMRALGWSAGLRLDIREAVGLLVVHARPDGEFQVTGQGHLRLPALIRHRCGLEPGDRVLLAADPPQRRLVIYPPAVLDDLTAQQHHRVGLVGGESV